MTSRLQTILGMLERTPDDAFLLYAAAMEHRKAGDRRQAVAFFDRCIAVDANSCYAYYHKGQVLEEDGDLDAARAAYRAGIAAAQRCNDAKALSELQAALGLIA